MANKCPKCDADNPDTKTFCGDCGTKLPPSEEAAPSITKTIEAPKEELTRGSTLAGRYEIIEELGKGGMGRVYRVEDTRLEQEIALKLIKTEIAKDKKTIERFRNELKTTRMIAHKNVCRMFDLGEEEGAHFITMEYVSGQDLRGLIRQTGQLAVGTTVNIAKQVCEGLIEAHKLGVVHRDLKPSNIMIDKDGNARIMDFGIARSLETKKITGAGVMIGTPEYMSPEQVEGKEVDQRSDIYSLGVILYEMVTGQVPFEGDTPFTIGMKHKGEMPKDPKELNAQISDDLKHVILRCLEKEKENRFQSAGEVRSELENIEKGIPTTEKEIPERRPLTSRELTLQISMKKLLLPAIFVGALIVASVMVIWQPWSQKVFVVTPKIENSIAVISFKNQTGEPAYDHLQEVIPNLLITNLENTGLFYVPTWERMQDILKQMGVKQVGVIDSDLGFKLCQQEGIKAIAIGAFSKAGNVFIMDVKVLDAETKQTLRSTNTKGTGADSIFDSQIDELSRDMSLGLGAGLDKVEAAQLNIKGITTHSLEAYKYFLKGKEACNLHNWEDAKENLKKALEYDPTFAMAHVFLAWAYSTSYEHNAAKETIERAMEFADKTGKKDRLYLEALSAWFIERDPEKPYTILNELIQKYPKEKWAFHILGDFLQDFRGDNLGAISQYEKWLELDLHDANAIIHLISILSRIGDINKAEKYIKMLETVTSLTATNLISQATFYLIIGQFDKAIAKCKEALEVQPDFWSAYNFLTASNILKEDYEEAMRWANEYVSKVSLPLLKSFAHLNRGDTYWTKGAFNSALSDFDLAEKMAEVAKSSNLKAMAIERKAYAYLAQKEYELSQKFFENALESHLEDDPVLAPNFKAILAWQMGMLAIEKGLINSAEVSLSEFKTLLPEIQGSDVIKKFLALMGDHFEGEVLFVKGALDQALAAGFRALGPESLYWKNLLLNPPNPIFVYYIDIIARIYAKKGENVQAIQEYERLFKMSNSGRPVFIDPLFHYRLALLYERENEASKAKAEYEKFLDLWKDADPGIAEVEDAKQRLANIKK
jgi:serine/threonine protein kinase/tetratricopeptide (TPR) repeat protein